MSEPVDKSAARARRAAALLLLVGGLGAAAAAPPPFSAQYSGALGLVRASVTLTRGESLLKYEFRSEVAGRVYYECSLLAVSAEGPAPLEYIHREQHGDGHRDQHVVFDRTRRTVRLTRGEHNRLFEDVSFPVWDALSVQLKLMDDLAVGVDGATYRIAEKLEIRTRRFRVAGRETVRHQGRDYQAIRVERAEEKPRFYVAFAPALHHIPVKFAYHTKLFGWVSANLTELSLPAATAGAPAPRCDPAVPQPAQSRGLRNTS